MAFIDQSEFEAMKTVSGWELSFLSYRCLNKNRKEERNKKTKNDTFAIAHFCV